MNKIAFVDKEKKLGKEAGKQEKCLCFKWKMTILHFFLLKARHMLVPFMFQRKNGVHKSEQQSEGSACINKLL